jgi:hypothetical protein
MTSSIITCVVAIALLYILLFGLLYITVTTVGKLLELDDLKHDDKHVDEIKIEVENEK